MWLVNLLKELRRRRVFHMTAWHILASWVLIQVASEALPSLSLDERTIRYFYARGISAIRPKAVMQQKCRRIAASDPKLQSLIWRRK